MKNDGKLKIGGKGVAPVTVPVRQAESLDDLAQLAKGNTEVITRWANRGFRIESQERSGARDKLKELRAANAPEADVQKQIAELVAGYDATQKAARGGPRGPKQVTVKTGKGGKIDIKSFMEQLAAAGVKVNLTEEQVAAATGAPATAGAPA